MRGRLLGTAVLVVTIAGVAYVRAQDVDYNKQVQPVFEKFCYKCHGEQKQKGKLRLDTPTAVLKGGENGPVVKPGKSDDSSLYLMLTTEKASLRMPPKGARPSKSQIDAIKKWIDAGAKVPAGK